MAIIPPYFLNTVVALGIGTVDNPMFNATGFLYRHPNNQLYLVTNRHVMEGSTSMIARFNRANDLGSKRVSKKDPIGAGAYERGLLCWA